MARGYRFGVVGSLSLVPDGSTVTPTDDITIWLKCGRRSETYTTLSQVLADSTCLGALIADNNAVNYMVRSTTWASTVCADSGAMTLIGGNNYCANTLLGDSTWLNAICNSTYFESVLNVKVPTMTSNTTPSGECGGSTKYNNTYDYYKAFNGNNNSYGWLSADNDTLGTAKVYYHFTSSLKVLKSEVYLYREAGAAVRNAAVKISGSNDGTTWVDVSEEISVVNYNQLYSAICSPNTEYEYYCIRLVVGTPTSAGSGWHAQFYGRQDV